MFSYYLELALRSLRRNRLLTVLMVLALAMGIGASITTLTVLRLLSGDPLPQKSAQLYYIQVDPYSQSRPFSRSGQLPWLMSYVDAMNLLDAHRATRQAAIALTHAKVAPQLAGQRPFFSDGVMTTADFFAMFDVPFRFGAGWSAADDQAGTPVAVIAEDLNQRLFGGVNSVGRSIRVGDRDFRIVGVLGHWAPQPHFYALDLGGRDYGKGDALFLSLHAARTAGMAPINTFSYATGARQNLETASVIWLGLWVQLPNAAAAADYRQFLAHYTQQQVALGRFQRSDVGLSSLVQWLDAQRVVPDTVRMQTGLAFSFLVICILNTVGLLLAKCLSRANEIGVRRAMGASRAAIFAQFMVEAGLIGLAGGMLGWLMAEFGLWCIRQQPADYAGLAHLDGSMFATTFIIALASSIVAGLLPAWRACMVMPAPQLKAA